MKKLPLNLQFFAEDPNPASDPAPASAPAATNVDQIVAAALTAMEARQQRAGNSVIQSMAEQHGMSADELTAAIERAKAEKAKQLPPDVQKQLDEANAKVAAFQNKEAALAAGVNTAYLDFVIFEAQKGVKDGTDFAASLTAYLEKNPQFKAAPSPQAWGMPRGNAPQQMDGVESRFYELNPRLKK